MRRIRTRLGHEDGFTLIEMLVAGIVLAIGIGAAVTILISSGKASSTAERHEVGVKQAEQAIEQVRSLPYNQVGLNAAPPASQAPGDPPSRVTGTNFNTIGASQESLVLPGDEKVPSPQVTPVSTVSVGSGSGATTAKVYRFVTWRNESCALIPASLLELVSENSGQGTIHILEGLISSLGNPLISNLTALVGSIDSATTTLTGLLNQLLGTLLNAANGIVAKGADLRPAATALLATLTTTQDEAQNLQDNLEALNNISFCNIDLALLLDLRTRIERLRTDNPTGLYLSLSNNLNNVSTVSNLFNIDCGNLNLLCLVGGLLTNVNNQLASQEPALKTNLLTANSPTLQQIAAEISALADDVNRLAESATTTNPKNSKRVVVAVVLDPSGSVGPVAPIWMTTVISDPKAGLLG